MIIPVNHTLRLVSDERQWMVQQGAANNWRSVAYFGGIPSLIKKLTRKDDARLPQGPVPVPSLLRQLASHFESIDTLTRKFRFKKPEQHASFFIPVSNAWSITADAYQFIIRRNDRPVAYTRNLGEAVYIVAARRIRMIEGEAEAAILSQVEQIERDTVEAVRLARLAQAEIAL